MSHPKLPPSIPTVIDEAGDTPGWVPALGFGLFAAVALVIAIRLANPSAPSPAPNANGTGAVAADANADDVRAAAAP
jgi:hypothetical protein